MIPHICILASQTISVANYKFSQIGENNIKRLKQNKRAAVKLQERVDVINDFCRFVFIFQVFELAANVKYKQMKKNKKSL